MAHTLTNPLLLYSALILGTLVALAWALTRGQGSSSSRKWLALSASPGLLALLTVFSLALHLHSSLGDWPGNIGTEGFTQALLTHYNIAAWLFTAAILLAIGMPLVILVCALAPRLRAQMIYPSLCGVACWLCLFLTTLAPSGFLDWWWD